MRRGWVIALVAIVVIGVALWYFTRDNEQTAAFRARASATRMLGEYLGKKFPNARVVLISNPFTQSGAPPDLVKMEQAGIDGLRQGFGSKTKLNVAYPELKPGAASNPRTFLTDPETATPLSYLVAEDSFDKLAAESDVVVSLIGLPVRSEERRVG